MRKVKIIEVKSELGAGTRGASLGTEAIKIAALDFGSLYFKRHPSVTIPDENHLLLEPIRHEYSKRLDGIITVCERLSQALSGLLTKGEEFPIVLAGDHSTAVGTISGIRSAFPDKELGVIWIDAHADIHSPFTTLSGNVHGMPLAALLNEDNREQKNNQPDDETIKLWERFKRIGDGKAPKIKYSNVIFAGVRDYEKQEEYLMRKNNIRNFTVHELRQKGPERAAFETLNALDHCDLIYISYDVDCLDPSFSRGTGTPVPGGFTEKEAGAYLARLMKSRKVCCLEITEVNPTLDKENQTAEKAFELLLKVTNQLINEL